jgi:Fe-S cluster assembly protein SufD
LTFTSDASAALDGPDWLVRRRQRAWDRFSASQLPTPADDLWKYSEIDALDIGSFGPQSAGPRVVTERLLERARGLASLLGDRSGLAVTLDGILVHKEAALGLGASERSSGDPDGAIDVYGAVQSEHGAVQREEHETVLVVRDAMDDLHSAFVGDIVHLEVPAKARIQPPFVVVHLVSESAPGSAAPASFPHTHVRLGTSAEARVVEVVAGAEEVGAGAGVQSVPSRRFCGLVSPVAELDVADDSRLSYALVQLLPSGWAQLGVQAGRVGREASLRSFYASLGASFGRLRADAELVGQGGEASLVAGYLGSGDQLHDLRTVQEHVAPRTRSQLLCMGAVTDHAKSVYVGLTRIRNGAHGADAFQTNRNLVLSEGAHADSVPNLDIQENDVRCSHASTVGPIDEEQMYYLESRGIEPSVAERLIVLGFFKSLSRGAPLEPVGRWFVSAVADRLESHADHPAGYSRRDDLSASSGEEPGSTSAGDGSDA